MRTTNPYEPFNGILAIALLSNRCWKWIISPSNSSLGDRSNTLDVLGLTNCSAFSSLVLVVVHLYWNCSFSRLKKVLASAEATPEMLSPLAPAKHNSFRTIQQACKDKERTYHQFHVLDPMKSLYAASVTTSFQYRGAHNKLGLLLAFCTQQTTIHLKKHGYKFTEDVEQKQRNWKEQNLIRKHDSSFSEE